MNASNNVAGIILAMGLIFGGLMLNSCESRGVSNSLVSLTEAVDHRFEQVDRKLDMIMYGQLVGGNGGVVVVK